MCIITCIKNQYVTVDDSLVYTLTKDRKEALEFDSWEEAEECINKNLSGEDRLNVIGIEDLIDDVRIETDEHAQKIYDIIGSQEFLMGRYSDLFYPHKFVKEEFLGLTVNEALNYISGFWKDILKENKIEVRRLDGTGEMWLEKQVATEYVEEEIKNHQLSRVEDWCKLEYKDKECRCYGWGEKHQKKILKYLKSKVREEQSIQWQNCKNRKERKDLKMLCRSVGKKVKKYYTMWNKYVGQEDVLQLFTRTGRFAWCEERWQDHIGKDWFLDGMDWPWDESYAIIYVKIKGGKNEAEK